jgi:hypothetical protein
MLDRDATEAVAALRRDGALSGAVTQALGAALRHYAQKLSPPGPAS